MNREIRGNITRSIHFDEVDYLKYIKSEPQHAKKELPKKTKIKTAWLGNYHITRRI